MPLPPIQDIRHARRHDADPHNPNQYEEQGIATHDIEYHEADAEDHPHGEGRRIECTKPVAHDLHDQNPEPEEQEARESRQYVTVISGTEEEVEGQPRGEQKEDP